MAAPADEPRTVDRRPRPGPRRLRDRRSSAPRSRPGVPVLGICRGHQMLNVALGGTLDRRPPATRGRALPDRRAADRRPHDHVVRLRAGIPGREHLRTEARVQLLAPPGRRAPAARDSGRRGRAQDGVVESIEMPGRPVLGVQWHPEWQATPDPVFAWLVDAARTPAPSSPHPLPPRPLRSSHDRDPSPTPSPTGRQLREPDHAARRHVDRRRHRAPPAAVRPRRSSPRVTRR